MNTKPYCVAIPVIHGELTIVTSDHAKATMKHSAKLAASLLEARRNVLNVNCGMSDQRYRKHFYQTIGESVTANAVLHSSDCGDLAADSIFLEQAIVDKEIEVLIISGWEFASSDTRRKQRLIVFLRRIMRLHNVAIIIYAHNANKPQAGKMDKAGVGSLSLLACEVVNIHACEALEEMLKNSLPISIDSEDEAVSAELPPNEINDLHPMGTGNILRAPTTIFADDLYDESSEEVSRSLAFAA